MNPTQLQRETRRVHIAPVRKTVRVNAAAAHAFEVFTAGFARWWPRSHCIGKSAMKEGVLEQRAGGRWYEVSEDGSECEWGKVLVWEPPTRLVLGWQINTQFKYDPTVISEIEIRFVAEGPSVTVVNLEHRDIERLGANPEEFRTKVDAPNGWSAILALFAAYAARE